MGCHGRNWVLGSKITSSLAVPGFPSIVNKLMFREIYRNFESVLCCFGLSCICINVYMCMIFMYLFVCVCVHARMLTHTCKNWEGGCVCHTTLVGVRGTFCVVASLLYLYMGPRVLTQVTRACVSNAFPAKPSSRLPPLTEPRAHQFSKAGQWAPGVLQPPLPQCCNYWCMSQLTRVTADTCHSWRMLQHMAVYMGAGERSSGPHAYSASGLLTKPLHLPPRSMLFVC